MKCSIGNNHVSLGNGESSASAIHRIVRWSRRKLGFFRKNKAVYNFSEIETSSSGSAEIQRLVREAGKAAASEAKAVGIPKCLQKMTRFLNNIPMAGLKQLLRLKVLKKGCFLEV